MKKSSLASLAITLSLSSYGWATPLPDGSVNTRSAAGPGEIQVAHEDRSNARGKGVVNSVNEQAHTINLSHEAIAALGWPAMRMDFVVSKEIDLTKIQAGSKIDFALEKSKAGNYQIHSIDTAPHH